MNKRTVNNHDQGHSTVRIAWSDEDVDEAMELQVQECAERLGVDPVVLMGALTRGDLGTWPRDEQSHHGAGPVSETTEGNG